MKMFTFTLTNENINKHLMMAEAKAEKARADRKMLRKALLSLEEVLLNYQARFGEEHEVSLKYRNRLSDFLITLDLVGESCNPFESAGNENDILNALNLAPRYSYYSGINRVQLNARINSGRNDFIKIIASVLIGVSLGYLGRMMPINVLETCHLIVQSISNSIFGLMKMIALPVIFLCIIYGILGSGTISSFKEKGRSIIVRMALAIFLMLVFATVVSISSYGIHFVSGNLDNASFKELNDTIFSIIPNNIVTPFMNGDSVKVIILGIVFGCGLLTLGDKVVHISQVIILLKDVCTTIMAWIGKLIPLLVVVVLMDNIWRNSFGPEIFTLWRIMAVYMVIILLILLYYIVRVSSKLRISVGTVVNAVIMPGVKALVSASSMFCIADMEDGLRNNLKVAEDRIDLGIPLGFAFYQPITIMYAVFVLYFAEISAVPVNAVWMVSFLLSCFVTGIAAPPVSGGSVTLLAILFQSLGIADPAIAMAYPLFMLMDYPNTSFRVMTMMLEVAKD